MIWATPLSALTPLASDITASLLATRTLRGRGLRGGLPTSPATLFAVVNRRRLDMFVIDLATIYPRYSRGGSQEEATTQPPARGPGRRKKASKLRRASKRGAG